MKIVIDIPEQIYLNAKADLLCGGDVIVKAIKNGIPHETVTEFADRCRECGREKVLDKIRAEIKEWYWQADKQALAKDPCVVDAMIDLFIRTIDKYKAESEENEKW